MRRTGALVLVLLGGLMPFGAASGMVASSPSFRLTGSPDIKALASSPGFRLIGGVGAVSAPAQQSGSFQLYAINVSILPDSDGDALVDVIDSDEEI